MAQDSGAIYGAALWSEEARQGVRGQGRERGGKAGSETHVILGFRVPTTCDRKKFDDIIEWLGVRTTGEQGGKTGERGSEAGSKGARQGVRGARHMLY